jgi:hypothetical protein
MNPINSEQILININGIEKTKNKNIFLNCLNVSNTLYYLDKEDILNLSSCSKSTYQFVEENNLLFLHLLNRNQLE